MNKVVTGMCSLVPGGRGHRSTWHPGSPTLAQAISWVYYFYICVPFPRILQEIAGLCGISSQDESQSFLMKKPDTLWLSSLTKAPRPGLRPAAISLSPASLPHRLGAGVWLRGLSLPSFPSQRDPGRRSPPDTPSPRRTEPARRCRPDEPAPGGGAGGVLQVAP